MRSIALEARVTALRSVAASQIVASSCRAAGSQTTI